MRLALWAALAVQGASLSLLALAELSLLVSDRLFKGSGALPLLLIGALAISETPLTPLTTALLLCLIFSVALSHAFPSRVSTSFLLPFGLVASMLPLIHNPSLLSVVFAAPLVVHVASHRLRWSSSSPSEEAWFAGAVLCCIISFTTRAHPLRAFVDVFIGLGLLGVCFSIDPPPRLAPYQSEHPLQWVAPPMLIAFLYTLLSTPNSSIAALLPWHGISRVLITCVTATLLLVTTLYRRFLPRQVASPLLIAACALAGFVAVHSIVGLVLGGVSAALLTRGSSHTAPARVFASAFTASMLMLQLTWRAAPHLTFSAAFQFAMTLFFALLTTAWLAAPRLAPSTTLPQLTCMPPTLLALMYALLETELQSLIPPWMILITSLLLVLLSQRLSPLATWLVRSIASAKALLLAMAVFILGESLDDGFIALTSSFAVILLCCASASLLFPLHFRLASRVHFLSALLAAIGSSLVCTLLLAPRPYLFPALLASPLAAAPALWAWHHTFTPLLPLPLPLAAYVVFSASLIGPIEAVLLIAAITARFTPRPELAIEFAAAAGAAFICRPAPLLVSLLSLPCGVLWTKVLRGSPLTLLAEGSLALLFLTATTAPALLRPLLFLRILLAASAAHLALLQSPFTNSVFAGPLSVPPPALAPIAIATSFAALRLAHLPFSDPLLLTLLSPILLLAPPPPPISRYAAPLALAFAALVWGTIRSCFLHSLATAGGIAALIGSISILQTIRVLGGGLSSSYAMWLIPVPIQIVGLILGSHAAPLLSLLSFICTWWLVYSGYRKHRRDLATI